jgi:hypothetical protein
VAWTPRERSFSYLFNGAPTITIYGISFPFSVVISDQQRGFRQPFNQYGISPQYKWLTVHAGWQSITWSPFTLAGYNFLGGGVEATPSKWRLGFIYGRFNKAIEENSTQPLSFQTPAYKQHRLQHPHRLRPPNATILILLYWMLRTISIPCPANP